MLELIGESVLEPIGVSDIRGVLVVVLVVVGWIGVSAAIVVVEDGGADVGPDEEGVAAPRHSEIRALVNVFIVLISVGGDE